jgi:hypothetical protein
VRTWRVSINAKIKNQIEKRFTELSSVGPNDLSGGHQELWQWLEAQDELEQVLDQLESNALKISSIEGLTHEVIEGPAPLRVLSSIKSSEDYTALLYRIAKECVDASDSWLELKFGKRLGAQHFDEAVQLFYEVVLEPLGEYLKEQFDWEAAQQQAPKLSYKARFSGGSKQPSVVQRFKAIEERLRRGFSIEAVAAELGTSASHVSDLRKLRLVPERMRLLVHHNHYAPVLKAWKTYRLEDEGIRFHLNDKGDVVIHGISWENALTMGNQVAAFQLKNDLCEEQAFTLISRYFKLTDISFEHSGGTGFGLIDAARLLPRAEFVVWLRNAIEAPEDDILGPDALLRYARPSPTIRRTLFRLQVRTVSELLNIDFEKTQLSPTGRKAVAIRELQDQVRRQLEPGGA